MNIEAKALKLQNVPRKKVADGIPAAIYKDMDRCGDKPWWVRELQEREFIINQGLQKILYQRLMNYRNISKNILLILWLI